MNGGHDAGEDADLLVQNLGERREAVRGARRVRDDRVGGLEHMVVHAVHDRRVDVFGTGCGNHHLFRTGGEVCGGLRLAREEAGALENHLHAEFTPGQLRRIALRDHPDPVAVDDHVIAVDVHLTREFAVCGVIARQMRIRLRVAQIVDCHDLDLVFQIALVERAQNVPPDAPISIDADLDCHRLAP